MRFCIAMIAACTVASVGASSTSPRTVHDLRVFFAHQSVGNDILAGLREVAPSLRVVRGTTPPGTPAILETPIGRNEDPESKLAEFARAMDAMRGRVDVAILKFCYVDITDDTDLQRLQRRYAQTMAALAARHPGTEFVHVTVPLTITQEGPKALVKRLLGYPLGGEHPNRARAAYNDWLRRTYASEALFDLAAVQSHTPDGDEVVFELDGRAYPRLYSGYTTDGTHLAGEGRRRAAKALLDVLGGLARNLG